MGIVEQELDESLLWLELLTESGMFSKDQMTDLIDETEQLLRIVVTCGRKTKVRMQSEKNRSRKTTNAK
jgi:four helix bundle protein